MIRGCWPGESRPRPGGRAPVFGWARQQALQRGFDEITIGCEPTGHRCGILDQLAAQRVPTARLNAEAAAQVATTLQPLATPSRLLILPELRQALRAVTDLAEKQCATPHGSAVVPAIAFVSAI